MEISVSKSTHHKPWAHTYFEAHSFETIVPFLKSITSRFWSPIIWQNGQRKGSEFLYSDFMVLDFDDGAWDLDEAVRFCDGNNYKYVIGTTINHMKQKGIKAPCPRFRLIIPWNSRISCKKTYEQNMARISKLIPCDAQCKDSARMFRPCSAIYKFDVSPNRKKVQYFPYRNQKRYSVAGYRAVSLIPRWLEYELQRTPVEGERNLHAFKLAVNLAKLGFSESDVIDKVLSSPIDIPMSGKLATIRSGYRNGVSQLST
jgi:hypothetical protein